ncbi:MAG: flagellar hook-basal body complex protein FliE [Phycisphaerales bacterium]|nr:MAG: flagellar hook-basal body complex protein FliE [Phycisphaerales bacterium]UCF33723.1 MAG: flagellar hook-basal body complex protein FliE [Phycisphaerales bacterium]
MTNPVNVSRIGGQIGPLAVLRQGPQEPQVEGKDFKSVLLDSLNQVNQLQREADQGVQRLLTGETQNVAEVLAAVNKADIAFDLLMEVRNKLTDAYQEIQQMRV